MQIIYRAEVDVAAHLAVHDTSINVENAVERSIGYDSLRDLDVKIRYIPIIMDDYGRGIYKARSRLERKSRIYNCCPQLEIEPFLIGTKGARYAEYIGGLRECGPALAKLGATDSQINTFNHMLVEVLDKLTSSATYP